MTVRVLWAVVPLRGPAVSVAWPGARPLTVTGAVRLPAGTVTLAGTLAMAFGAWWYYFRPLKEKVHVLDLEFHSGLTEVRADIRHVDSDLQEFKQEMRRDMREVRRGVQTLLARSA